MKPWLTAAAVVVVVALLAGASLLFFTAPGQVGGTTSSGTSGTSSTSVGASNGLQLRLALNTTALLAGAPPGNYRPDSRLGISISEYNTKATANNVSAAQLWKVNGLTLGACGTEVYPFGVAVFRGRYTSTNVSQAQPLRVYPAVPCPMLIRLVTGYLFEPMNDSAVILPSSSSSPKLMSANVTVFGEYSGSSALLALSPGVYTVAAGDEWGAVATLQFSVGGQTQTSTTASGSGGLSLQLSIGPTAPVCRSNATTGPAPSPYSSISVVITPSSGQNMTFPVSWLSNGCEVSGSLRASLAPGNYQLSLSSCAFMGCKSALPKGFTVVAGQTTSLSVSVDTGIR